MTTTKIEQEKIDYIRSHLDERPRCAVAKKLGISISTFYYYLRLCGGEITEQHRLTEADRQRIKELYEADYSIKQIAKITGIWHGSIDRVKTQMKLQHSENFKAKTDAERTKRLRKVAKEMRQQITDSRNKTVKREMRRFLGGEKQKTKLKFRRVTKKAAAAMAQLKYLYNYVYDNDIETYVMYYDDETKRTPRERHYVEKYGITFKPMEQ